MAKRGFEDCDHGRNYRDVQFPSTIASNRMAELKTQWDGLNRELGRGLDALIEGKEMSKTLLDNFRSGFNDLVLFWRENLRMLHNALALRDAPPSQVRLQSPLQEEGGVRDILSCILLDKVYCLATEHGPCLSEDWDSNLQGAFKDKTLNARISLMLFLQWDTDKLLQRDRDDLMIMYGRASDRMDWVPVGFSSTKVLKAPERRLEIRMPKGAGTFPYETGSSRVGSIRKMLSLAKAFGVHINGLGAAWLFDAAFDRFKTEDCKYATIGPANDYLEGVYGRYGFKAGIAVDVDAFATVISAEIAGSPGDAKSLYMYPEDMVEMVRTVQDYENMTKGVSTRAQVHCRFCQSRFDMMDF